IDPLFDVRSAHQLLAIVLGSEARAREPLDIVRRTWQADADTNGEAFETFWRRALHEGVVPDSAAEAQDVALAGAFDAGALPAGDGGAGDDRITLILRPDHSLWDGR